MDSRMNIDADSCFEILQLSDEETHGQRRSGGRVSGSSSNTLISPNTNLSNKFSSKERLMRAICNLIPMIRDRSLLIQIWMPERKEDKIFLTTIDQPFLYDSSLSTSKSLANYRDASVQCIFSADEDSKELLGLPGRVFLAKAADWSPDVQFFGQDECPRVIHACLFDVHGSIALPVFQEGNCLGVVEIVTTQQKITYRSEVEAVCQALKAVDLRSSEMFSPSEQKGGTELHSPELLRILKTICDENELPLGQTWCPCTQMSKCMRYNSNKKTQCVSIVNSACYIRDKQVFGFHEACCDKHLLTGQGVVGEAFETNKPRYCTDVTAKKMTEYPLSHYAKIFGLRGAVAMHVQSRDNARESYVLEFFLPVGIQDPEKMFQVCCNLNKDLTEMVLRSKILCFSSSKKLDQYETISSGKSKRVNDVWIFTTGEAHKRNDRWISFENGSGEQGRMLLESSSKTTSSSNPNHTKKPRTREHVDGSPTNADNIRKTILVNYWSNPELGQVSNDTRRDLSCIELSDQGDGLEPLPDATTMPWAWGGGQQIDCLQTSFGPVSNLSGDTTLLDFTVDESLYWSQSRFDV